jgi:hypothetical protein
LIFHSDIITFIDISKKISIIHLIKSKTFLRAVFRRRDGGGSVLGVRGSGIGLPGT